MLNWLKDKTIVRIQKWLSRLYVRAVGELTRENLQKRADDAPIELKPYFEVAALMNNNAIGLHNLYKKAKDKNKFQEAFLYFFYEFEINIKHLIMSQMVIINLFEATKKVSHDFFLIYSLESINAIQKIGQISELIKTFCLIHGEEIKTDLETINRERNFIIHNMLKNQMTEGQIRESFKHFFEKTNLSTKNTYSFFIKLFDERRRMSIN
jgi:hypothetical protein